MNLIVRELKTYVAKILQEVHSAMYITSIVFICDCPLWWIDEMLSLDLLGSNAWAVPGRRKKCRRWVDRLVRGAAFFGGGGGGRGDILVKVRERKKISFRASSIAAIGEKLKTGG